MKKFIFSLLCVSVFFVGLGVLVEKTGAKFKSDEKALELIRNARQAIGGDTAIAGIKSLRIVGSTSTTSKVNGVDQTEQGETEIAFQLPDKLMKTMKIGHDDGSGSGEKTITKQVQVVVVGGDNGKTKVAVDGEGSGEGSGVGSGVKRIVIKKDDGSVQELTGAEADKFVVTNGAPGENNVTKIVIKRPDGTVEELNRADSGKVIAENVDGDKTVFTNENGKVSTSENKQVIIRRMGSGPGVGAQREAMRHNEMLRLTLGLLMTAPEGMDVNYTYGGDGDVDGTACDIVVAEFGGSSFKIYLNKSSNLPVMMSYVGVKSPTIITYHSKDLNSIGDTTKNVVVSRKITGHAPETAEFNIKFSDYRPVDGVQLPYKWVQTVGGIADETFDVTSYEINPANIAEKFQNQNVVVRAKKPDGQ